MVHKRLSFVVSTTGIKPEIYCDRNTILNVPDASFAEYNLWIAAYGANVCGLHPEATPYVSIMCETKARWAFL